LYDPVRFVTVRLMAVDQFLSQDFNSFPVSEYVDNCGLRFMMPLPMVGRL
jgi:hypothetical protein